MVSYSKKNKLIWANAIHLNLIMIIALGHCLYVKSNKFKFKENCEQHLECLSKRCTPLCDNSSKKICIQPSWFYHRHGINFPQCAETNIDYSYLYNRRKVGETCHNDTGCESKHCLKECSSKKMKCAESKWFYKQDNIAIPECIDRKADMEETSKISLHARFERNAVDRKEKDNVSQIEYPMDKKGETRIYSKKRLLGNSILGMKDSVKDFGVEKNLVKQEQTTEDVKAQKSNHEVIDYDMKNGQNPRRRSAEKNSEAFNQDVDNDDINLKVSVAGKREKTVFQGKIDEEALAKLKKSEFRVHLPKTNTVKKITVKFLSNIFSFLFGVKLLAFLFLILPFVLIFII